MKTKAILLAGLLVFGVVGGGIVLHMVQTEMKPETRGWILSPLDNVILRTELPKAPSTLPVYKVVSSEIVSTKPSADMWRAKEDLPSEEDAVTLAIKVLEEYGGVPEDAVLYNVETVYLNKFNTEIGEVVERYPLWVAVKYEREINGMPVVGPGGEIDISLGENGEVVYFSKIWRTLKYVGEVKIIPASEALEKLKRRELIDKPMSPLEIEITQIKLGYYAEGPGEIQEFYEPVWVFYCKDRLNNAIRLCVEATA